MPKMMDTRLRKIVGTTAKMHIKLVSIIDFLPPIHFRTGSIANEPKIRPETPALEIAVLFLVSSSPQSSFWLRIPPT